MKQETKHKLFWAWAYCDEYDKSTEFMLQFMQDVGGVDLDAVISFMDKNSKRRSQWYRENQDWENNNPQLKELSK